ncbi:hypothetical protein JVT61DRAFT_13190 [Boletus reticuloceps]|uniref:Uncharacterized protein n=1 Tax=Boletus reticuloceps TaxID=495285 RepID=A0A8I3AE01_9AGAM|nr:hypothetical protein JVT61DRAFT_13190 [Boletus reticuloceps]
MSSTATLLAQAPSSVDQSMSISTGPNGCALLGKRYSNQTLHGHGSSTEHSIHNAWPVKRQKMAMHVNTRHIVPHYPNARTLPHQGDAAASQSHINSDIGGVLIPRNPSPLEMDASNQHTTESTHTINVQCSNNTAGSNILPSSSTNVSNEGQQQKCRPTTSEKPKEPSIGSSKTTSPTSLMHHNISATTTSSRTRVNKDTAFLPVVQRWTDTLVSVCDVYNNDLYVDLFADKPISGSTSNVPDLLYSMLMEIDDKKNDITLHQQQATDLAQAIARVQTICNSLRGLEKSTTVANRILSNFHQRFRMGQGQSSLTANFFV